MKHILSIRLPHKSFAPLLLSGTNIILILLVLTLLSNTMGALDLSILRLISLSLLLGVILLNLPLKKTVKTFQEKKQTRTKIFGGTLLLMFAAFLLLFTSLSFLWLTSIPLLIAGLDLLLISVEIQRKELHLLTITSFIYAFIFLLISVIPFLWHLFQQISLLTSSAVGVLISTPLLLGPSVSGLWILILFLILFITTFLIAPRKSGPRIKIFLGWLIGLFLSWIISLIVLGVLLVDSNQNPIQFQFLSFLFCFIPTLLFFAINGLKELPEERFFFTKTTLKKYIKNGTVWAVLFLVLTSVLLTTFINASTPPSHTGKVVFYGQHMVGTWDIPTYGKYGRDAAGMFGLLPLYLTSLGYETEIIVQNRTSFLHMTQPPNENITQYMNFTEYTSVIESSVITRALLSDAHILIVTNLNVSFSPEEQQVIWEFVQNGGSLLVLGDHTNVGGLQAPLNHLLSPVGIRFRFDAALPLDQKFKWATCSELFYQPSIAYLTSREDLQIGVGASLDVTFPAEPLIIGTYALSDKGNQSNPEMAYLGDYQYNKGEQLGDVILAAHAYYGNGKVLVFGDTSPFQNTALPLSYQFLDRIFNWLNSTQTATTYILQTGLAFLFLFIALIMYRFLHMNRLPFFVFPLAVCVTLLISTTIQPLLLPAPLFDRNIVSIDASHGERFSRELFTDESLTGVMLNLNRNNYLPLVTRGFSQEIFIKSRIIAFNAPTETFSSDEVTFLEQYMTKGGFVILATGYEDKDASEPLLQAFNLGIEQIPLGPIPYSGENTTVYQNEPRFVDSWPISFHDKQIISYYNFTWANQTYHLVALVKHGAGGLLLISDSQFLLDKNIESIYEYWPGNIIFLKQLLTEIKSMEEHP